MLPRRMSLHPHLVLLPSLLLALATDQLGPSWLSTTALWLVLLDHYTTRVAGTIFIAVHSEVDEVSVFLLRLCCWFIFLAVPVEDAGKQIEYLCHLHLRKL